MSTRRSARARAAARLAAAGVPEAAREAEWLLAHAGGWTLAALVAGDAEPLAPDVAERFDALVARRATGEPLAYLTGEREFHGLAFEVTPDVLIPRPETELLVDSAIALDAVEPLRRVVDVGSGSGCVAVAVAVRCPGAEVLATDVSAAALAVAARNAARHGAAGRVRFAQGDLCAPAREAGWAGTVDLLLANLPYVADGEAPTLQREVLREPPGALFAGPDGLGLLRRLVAEVPGILRPGGTVCVEVGLNQAARVADLLREAGCHRPQMQPDLQGIPRVVSAQRPLGR